MNDDSVTSSSSAPLNAKSAYVLFYCRERGDGLNAILNGSSSAPNGVGSINGAGKRGRESDVGQAMSNGNATKKAFIGPQIPSPTNARPRPTSNPFVAGAPARSTPDHRPNPFPQPQPSSPSANRSYKDEQEGLFKSNARKAGKQYSDKGKGGKLRLSTTGAMRPRVIRS